MSGRHQKSRLWWVIVLSACGSVMLALVVSSVGLESQAEKSLAEARRIERTGDLVAANRIYLDVLEDDAEEIEAVRGLAVNLAIMSRFDEALPYQEQTVRLDPTDAQTWVELAFNYMNHQDEPRKGLEAMSEGARLDPSPRNRTFLAQALDVNGETASALGELEAVLVDDPDYEYAQLVKQRILDPSEG